MSGAVVLENKLVAVTTDQNYHCYDWIIKFSCNCDDCLRRNPDLNISTPRDFTRIAVSPDANWDLILSINSPSMPITINFRHRSSGSRFNELLKIGIRDKKNAICYSTEYLNINNKLLFVHPYSIRNCNYWHEGVLKIVVEIFKPGAVFCKCIVTEMTLTHAEKVLKNLQESNTLADVTLVVGEQEFPAHKAILAAQSSVFLAMFQHDMKEKTENKVIIEDITVEVLQLVLNYMYTGSADKTGLKDLVSDVLVAADKYALEDLVKICEKVLTEGLNNDNVFKFLQTANFYKLDSLKKAAVNLIACEIKVLMETDEFNNLENSSVKEIILALKNG